MLTDTKVLRALRVLEARGVCHPREFARDMWPESEGWRKPSRRPWNGGSHGNAMGSAGACFLGRLRAQGLVARMPGDDARYALSPSGMAMLQAAAAHDDGKAAAHVNVVGRPSCVGPFYWTPSGWIVWSGTGYVPWRG